MYKPLDLAKMRCLDQNFAGAATGSAKESMKVDFHCCSPFLEEDTFVDIGSFTPNMGLKLV